MKTNKILTVILIISTLFCLASCIRTKPLPDELKQTVQSIRLETTSENYYFESYYIYAVTNIEDVYYVSKCPIKNLDYTSDKIFIDNKNLEIHLKLVNSVIPTIYRTANGWKISGYQLKWAYRTPGYWLNTSVDDLLNNKVILEVSNLDSIIVQSWNGVYEEIAHPGVGLLVDATSRTGYDYYDIKEILVDYNHSPFENRKQFILTNDNTYIDISEYSDVLNLWMLPYYGRAFNIISTITFQINHNEGGGITYITTSLEKGNTTEE